jgi:sigma-B regulation protein RsbU (phosphoserine phosphatase)
MNKILIVDQDTYFMDKIYDVLMDEENLVYMKNTLKESIDIILDAQLDMVLISVAIDNDFEGEIKKIREADENISIVLIIKDNLGEIVSKTLNIGVNDYILKPIMDVDEFLVKIEKNLELKQLKKANKEQLEMLKKMNNNLNTHLKEVQSDLIVGSELQRKMLPKNEWSWSGLEFSYMSVPSHYLSGDFIGYQEINENECLFYLIDVSGHGPSSAFVALIVYNIIEKYKDEIKEAQKSVSPSDLAYLINEEIHKANINKHLVGVFGVVNKTTNEITYTNAGLYPKPLVISESESYFLEKNSMAIGLIPKIIYKSEKIILEKGSRILIMSDGILDEFSGSTLKEAEDKLKSKLKETSNMDILKDGILKKDKAVIDDLTILQINCV